MNTLLFKPSAFNVVNIADREITSVYAPDRSHSVRTDEEGHPLT